MPTTKRSFSWRAAAMACLVAAAHCATTSQKSLAHAASASASAAATTTDTTTTTTTYKTVQVHVVHRHGDRSTITPMKDVEYWQSQLIPPEQLEKIAEGTKLVRDGDPFYHSAGGKGAFGKLTELGLLQMIRVGLNLKEELTQAPGHSGLLFTPLFEAVGADAAEESENARDSRLPSLTKDHIRTVSTDFPRTIQSLQGLLMGLLDSGEETSSSSSDDAEQDSSPLEIDVRHTTMMIPDPHPRETREQELLEMLMMSQPHVLEQEEKYMDLATRATNALHPLLGEGAHEVAFGVVQKHPEMVSIETEPLAWNQLAEITKCLAVRDILPPQLSQQDVETISTHTAWRWFETFKNPRLIYLAMHSFLQTLVDSMMDVHHHADTQTPPLHIWSAHDSTLIGLLSGFRLEQPSVWPEYASVLLMEVVEISTTTTSSSSSTTTDSSASSAAPELAVRFSLNGERLRSVWDPEEPPVDMIPLKLLAEKVRTVGAQPSAYAQDAQEQ